MAFRLCPSVEAALAGAQVCEHTGWLTFAARRPARGHVPGGSPQATSGKQFPAAKSLALNQSIFSRKQNIFLMLPWHLVIPKGKEDV